MAMFAAMPGSHGPVTERPNVSVEAPGSHQGKQPSRNPSVPAASIDAEG